MHKRTKGNIATYYVVIFLVLGLVGAVLRALELIRHYDRLTGLFEPFAAAPVLPLYVLVCALAAFACSWQYRGDAGPFVDVYALSRRPSIIARIVLRCTSLCGRFSEGARGTCYLRIFCT